MSAPTRTSLTPPTTVKYEIIRQEVPTGHPVPSNGNILITATNITIIPDDSGEPMPQYMAVAKLTWGDWEANLICIYKPNGSIFLKFECLMMNDAMRDDLRGRNLRRDEAREEGSGHAQLKICTAPVDEHNNWKLRVEAGGVKLWGKRVVDEGDEA